MNDVIDSAWLDCALRAARPRAVGALLRYFHDLDTAEEAFQEACLAALKKWPENGPPRDPAAWLILVGRNSAIDGARRRAKQTDLPGDDALSDLDDADARMASRLDDAPYRDDILRLLFVCCHPELPATQQIALALRLVCGLTVAQIARAFLVTDAAMEQRITRAKKRVTAAGLPFETPGAPERAERLAAVAAVVYLIFNEGYSATGGEVHVRAPLCDEAIRLGRLLLRLFSDEPSMMGLLALMLLQHARTAARLDADGNIVLLEDQDRGRWDAPMIAEGLALLDKAIRHRRPDPFQVQAAIAALHARAARSADTDWAEIELLYARLEQLQPSPVIRLNRAVAVAKTRGPADALAMIEPLASELAGYFYFHGLKGALLLQLSRPAEARVAFDQAISLANTAAEAAHIRMQLDRLMNPKEMPMQKITTFLTFAGKAEEAVHFYTSVFKDSKITSSNRYGDAGPLPKGTLLTATFELNGQEFIALNGGPSFTFAPGISLLINCESQEEVDHYWEKLSEGGEPQPCGWLTDKFGVSWQVVPTILGKMLSDKDPAKANRVMQAMLQMQKIVIRDLKQAYEG